ncbi:MAG TPA: sigma-70 family RNA polymerase sigma factor [Vicinamibacterales bacterium]|jgi:RNA polymerase sigma-70 factor (ECF subfamily)
MGASAPADVPGGSRTDAELLAAARRGDAAALEALLVRYQPRLYRFGLRMCGNVEDAGDVAQESLIAMARSLRDFRGDSSMSSWLYTIARRFCVRKRRRGKFAPTHEESLDAPDSEAVDRLIDPAPNPEHAAVGREIEAALARAISALDRGYREVLVLRDVEGLSALEVARVLGISVDAVKSRLHRARVAVRSHLAPIWGAPAEPARGPQCPDVLTLFSQHLEGEIDQTVCAKMEAHLAQCDQCRGACDTLKRTLTVCSQQPAPQMPDSIGASVRTALRAFLGAPRTRRQHG